MKSVLILVSVFLAASSFADDQVECRRGGDVLSFYVHEVPEGAPTLSGVRINGSSGDEGYLAFEEMLQASEKCTPIETLPAVTPDVFLCEGELVATRGIYGQVFLTLGGLGALLNSIAPAAGWNCSQ